jgi:hypothetical protein
MDELLECGHEGASWGGLRAPDARSARLGDNRNKRARNSATCSLRSRVPSLAMPVVLLYRHLKTRS